MHFEGGTEDALLQRFGERINVGISNRAVRDKLLMMVGESGPKHVVSKESTEEQQEVDLPPLEKEDVVIAYQ